MGFKRPRRGFSSGDFLNQYLQGFLNKQTTSPSAPTSNQAQTSSQTQPAAQAQPAPNVEAAPAVQTSAANDPYSAENFSNWSSVYWGNGWASNPGGVGRQLGLTGRVLGEFGRFVNAQRRLAIEKETGQDFGYNPEYSVENMPHWIKELYRTKGASGAAQATGKSGVGQYVNQAAYGLPGGAASSSGGNTSLGSQIRARGLTGRAAADFVRSARGR
jgi:hypothetical protein